MLGSPDAARLLNGLSLAEAFRKYVLNDPDVVSLASAAMQADSGYERVFRDAQCPGPYVDYEWPLDTSGSNLAFRLVRPVIFFAGAHDPAIPEVVQNVSDALATRITALRELLTSGQVIAHGTFEKTGMSSAIPRIQWQRRELWIDVQNSDLLETEGHKPALRWSGITFETQLPAPLSRPGNSEAPATRLTRRLTPQRESVDVAIKALWPEGQPVGVTVQVRDRAINDWQRQNGRAVTNPRTIRRHLKGD